MGPFGNTIFPLKGKVKKKEGERGGVWMVVRFLPLPCVEFLSSLSFPFRAKKKFTLFPLTA